MGIESDVTAVQACDPYAEGPERDVYFDVTIEKAKIAITGALKIWVRYNVDQSGQWVWTRHLLLDEEPPRPKPKKP